MCSNIIISIIIPIYNSGLYLDTMLKSILKNSTDRCEILLIDDCSIDESKTICSYYVSKFNNIHYYQNPNNLGQSYCRNYGVTKARGKYVLFFDSDDCLEDFSFEELFVCAENNSLDILGFGASISKGNEIFPYGSRDFNSQILLGEDHITRMIKNGGINDVVWMYLFNLSFLKKINIPFKIDRIFEDELWISSILSKAKRFMYINKKCYRYIVHNSSTMTREDNSVKKFIDKELNCKELIVLSDSFVSINNQRIMKDYIVRMYMAGVYYPFKEKKIRNISIDYRFCLHNIYKFSTFLKFILFCFSKKIFFYFKSSL